MNVEDPPTKTTSKPVDDFITDIPKLQKVSFLSIDVVNKIHENEKRASIVPSAAKRLLQKGMQVR